MNLKELRTVNETTVHKFETDLYNNLSHDNFFTQNENEISINDHNFLSEYSRAYSPDLHSPELICGYCKVAALKVLHCTVPLLDYL